MTLSPEACRRAAELLLAARRELSPIAALPEDCRPTTAAEGYRIQAALVAARGGELAGFKIGATSQVARALLATEEPFHGGLFADGIHDSPAILSAGDTNFRLIEPEFAFRLGADLPARKAPYGRDELVEAIAGLHPAFEVVNSAFGAAWTGAGLAQLIADNGVHACLVLGPAMADWRNLDLAVQEVVFESDGTEVGRGRGANALGHPLLALAWLADLGVLVDSVTQVCRGLRAGDLITTGLVTPFAYAEAGTSLRADFGPLGAVELAFSA
ncbi:MAG: 2-keto-4-pentenoate hydratase [Alphaproteobacteria bacterium]